MQHNKIASIERYRTIEQRHTWDQQIASLKSQERKDEYSASYHAIQKTQKCVDLSFGYHLVIFQEFSFLKQGNQQCRSYIIRKTHIQKSRTKKNTRIDQLGKQFWLHHEYKFEPKYQDINYYMSGMEGEKKENPYKSVSKLINSQQRLQTLDKQYGAAINNSNNRGVQNKKSKNLAKYTGVLFLNELACTKNKKRSLVWMPEQDQILFCNYERLGSKWVQLAQFLPEKSDNDVKNRFCAQIKKIQHRLNKIQKNSKLKPEKLINYSSLLTVLQISRTDMDLSERRFEEIKKNLSSILESGRLILEMVKGPLPTSIDVKAITLVEKMIALKPCLKFINKSRVRKCIDKNMSLLIEANGSMTDQSVKSSPEKSSLKEETQKIYVQNLNQRLNYSLDQELQLQSVEPLFNQQFSGLSLIQSCRDVLSPCLLSLQANDHLFFQ